MSEPFIRRAGNAAQQFHAEKLFPAIESVGERLSPAIKSVGGAAQHFHAHQLSPALKGVGAAAQNFHSKQVAPALKVIYEAAEHFHKDRLSPTLNSATATFAAHVPPAIELAGKFSRENPHATTAVGITLCAVGGAIILPAAGTVVLNAIGFSPVGPAAGTYSRHSLLAQQIPNQCFYYTGSLAAGIQSSVYGGATTGLFSLAQSATMTAAITPIVPLVAGSTVVGAGVGILRSRDTSKAFKLKSKL